MCLKHPNEWHSKMFGLKYWRAFSVAGAAYDALLVYTVMTKQVHQRIHEKFTLL